MNSELTPAEKALAIGFGMLVVGVIALALNVIPYLLWNHAIAPMFGWRHFGFWQIFALVWAIGFVGRLLFGHRAAK